MSRQEVSFPGSTGAELRGVLHTPPQPRGSVLMAHCFTCSKDQLTTRRLARGLAEANYAVLRFDFTGLGDSGGDFAATTIADDVADLVAAAEALIDRGHGPCGLLGHSLGGAAGLLAAHRLETVRSVVVLGTPASPRHLQGVLRDHEDEIRWEGAAVVEIAGRAFMITDSFLEELDDFDQQQRTAELDRPLMVIHALQDEYVDVEEGERIFAAARQPKAFVPLLGADHLLTSRAAADQAVATISQWFDATL